MTETAQIRPILAARAAKNAMPTGSGTSALSAVSEFATSVDADGGVERKLVEFVLDEHRSTASYRQRDKQYA